MSVCILLFVHRPVILHTERMSMVYTPKQYRMNHDEAVQMMKTSPFALLITVEQQRPLATHIPVEIREEEGKIYATGHIAYGNTQKKTLKNNRDVLLIFQGPHTDIQGAAKMSQNRNNTDYKSIVGELEKSNDQEENLVAEWLREQRKELFK
ncbi:FMN-binding negative transcriptional regulator [Brevibacillus sp. FSL K6-0770]|uniref:FMN-binding negative transcriptional regulator n=1 Tax=Brevibacillus sp. FSL K6-0770 TaxID=2954673 RepID=UPI0030F55254